LGGNRGSIARKIKGRSRKKEIRFIVDSNGHYIGEVPCNMIK
jgi:hypothetical protein